MLKLCIVSEGRTDGAINTPSRHICVLVKVIFQYEVPVGSADACVGGAKASGVW